MSADVASIPDGELARRAIGGDEHAFGVLVERHRPLLRRRLRSVVNDGELEADVLQRALFKAWRALPRFDPAKSFRSWLYTITVNVGLNAIRDRARRHRKEPIVLSALLSDDGEDRISHAEDPRLRPDRICESRELGDRIRQALAELPPIHRDVFLMRETEGLSYDAIAFRQGVTVGTVKSRLNRARATLAAALEEWRPAGTPPARPSTVPPRPPTTNNCRGLMRHQKTAFMLSRPMAIGWCRAKS